MLKDKQNIVFEHCLIVEQIKTQDCHKKKKKFPHQNALYKNKNMFQFRTQMAKYIAGRCADVQRSVS